jgi:hypothetical protein
MPPDSKVQKECDQFVVLAVDVTDDGAAPKTLSAYATQAPDLPSPSKRLYMTP